MGLKSIFVYPQESLCSFIQLAYDTAVSICKELEVKQQMSTIFQYSHQGILFTDRQGRISMCNDSAGKMLALQQGLADGGAVHRNKGVVGPGAVVVDRLGQHLFSGPCLPQNNHAVLTFRLDYPHTFQGGA